MPPRDPLLDDPTFSNELKALLRRPTPRRATWGLLLTTTLLAVVVVIVVAKG